MGNKVTQKCYKCNVCENIENQIITVSLQQQKQLIQKQKEEQKTSNNISQYEIEPQSNKQLQQTISIIINPPTDRSINEIDTSFLLLQDQLKKKLDSGSIKCKCGCETQSENLNKKTKKNKNVFDGRLLNQQLRNERQFNLNQSNNQYKQYFSQEMKQNSFNQTQIINRDNSITKNQSSSLKSQNNKSYSIGPKLKKVRFSDQIK